MYVTTPDKSRQASADTKQSSLDKAGRGSGAIPRYPVNTRQGASADRGGGGGAHMDTEQAGPARRSNAQTDSDCIVIFGSQSAELPTLPAGQTEVGRVAAIRPDKGYGFIRYSTFSLPRGTESSDLETLFCTVQCTVYTTVQRFTFR